MSVGAAVRRDLKVGDRSDFGPVAWRLAATVPGGAVERVVTAVERVVTKESGPALHSAKPLRGEDTCSRNSANTRFAAAVRDDQMWWSSRGFPDHPAAG